MAQPAARGPAQQPPAPPQPARAPRAPTLAQQVAARGAGADGKGADAAGAADGLATHSVEPLSPKLESMLAGVDEQVTKEIQESMDVLREALERYAFEELALSFNGGKDCTVVMHLLRAILEEKYADAGPERKLANFKFVYFKKSDEFPEMHAFVDQIKEKYGITVDIYPSSYKEGLAMMEAAGFKAVLMGQRRTDPYAANLSHFAHCTPGWPDIVRVNPILNWSYRTIWAFLRGCELEYCKLYDQGYTSLGSIHTTTKNPKLDDGATSRPAYELDDGDKYERVSRA